ncbi:unnamed protein product [Boreogadus saida]
MCCSGALTEGDKTGNGSGSPRRPTPGRTVTCAIANCDNEEDTRSLRGAFGCFRNALKKWAEIVIFRRVV